jgi:3-dehydroquinate dehydratase-2
MEYSQKVLILNGPNLNMLGTREPDKYGHATLLDADTLCQKTAQTVGLAVDCRQSNLEGELVGWIQDARKTHAGIIINAGGYSHSSVAILDALTLSELPVIEVHVTNIYAREEFRHHSLLSKAAKGVICGLGIDGYGLAVQAMAKLIETSKR